MFGSQAVTLVTYTVGTERDDFNQLKRVRTETPIEGVLMRTISGSEDTTLTEIATQAWRCTLPPIPAALAATAADELKYGDDTFHVIRVDTFSDFAGAPSHVRITCQLQTS